MSQSNNISFSAKQTMFWEALYELYTAPLSMINCDKLLYLQIIPFLLSKNIIKRLLIVKSSVPGPIFKALPQVVFLVGVTSIVNFY